MTAANKPNQSDPFAIEGANSANAFTTPETDAPQGAAKPSGRKAPSNRSKTLANAQVDAIGDALLDGIEVRKADGSVESLGATEKRGGAVPKAASVAGTAGKVEAPAKPRKLTPAQQDLANIEARKKASIEATKKKADAAKETAKQKLADEREAAKKKKAEDAAQAKKDKAAKAEQAKKDREEKAEKAKADREKKKADAAAAKLRSRGETGDAALDAAFHATVNKATELAVIPQSATGLGFNFTGIPGVGLTGTGLTLPDDLTLENWLGITAQLNSVASVGQWAMGDALLYGEGRFGQQAAVVAEALGLTSQYVKNVLMVCRAIPQAVRVAGLSFTHHMEVANLYNADPAAAANILQQALDNGEGKPRPASWVRQQVQAIKNAAERPAKATETKLVQLTNEQFEADLEDLTPVQIERKVAQDVDELITSALANDVVPSQAAMRNLARLQGIVNRQAEEINEWKARAEAAEARLAELGEAQARVADHAAAAASTTDDLDATSK